MYRPFEFKDFQGLIPNIFGTIRERLLLSFINNKLLPDTAYSLYLLFTLPNTIISLYLLFLSPDIDCVITNTTCNTKA